jgi:hypothetical protein
VFHAGNLMKIGLSGGTKLAPGLLVASAWITAGFICVCSQKRVAYGVLRPGAALVLWRRFGSLAPPPLVAKDYQSGDKSPHSIPVHATEKRCNQPERGFFNPCHSAAVAGKSPVFVKSA